MELKPKILGKKQKTSVPAGTSSKFKIQNNPKNFREFCVA